jgi:predicted dehydrogenase
MTGSLDTLRVAIAGCHRMLDTLPRGHNWANGFARVPETAVVAVFDKGAETREEFRSVWKDTWGDIPGYGDYGKMLAETKPDIVCVTTRQTMHADQIEAAVAAGVKGIACEKPFATSLEEADRIVSACRGAGVPLAYLLDRRWSAAYGAVRKLISEGNIGPVTNVVAFGASNLINHGPHWYDTALALAGDAEPVWTSGHVDALPGEPADSRRHMDPPGRSWTLLSNGAHIVTMPEGPARLAFNVYGTDGGLVSLNEAHDSYYWRNDADGGVPAGEPRPVEVPGDEEEWPAGRAAVQDLVDAVRSGGQTACDLDEARRATEIGFAIHASHRAGGARMDLPLADRTLRVESFPWGNE